eukprot:scaffold38884_cov66-Attheya_sp.AAC.4
MCQQQNGQPTRGAIPSPKNVASHYMIEICWLGVTESLASTSPLPFFCLLYYKMLQHTGNEMLWVRSPTKSYFVLP